MATATLNKPLVSRTPQELEVLRDYAKEQGLPENIYEDFAVFAHYMVPLIGEEAFEWQWFHYYICAMYNAVIFGGVKLFSIELPPQVGKSLLTSLFIVYCFGINPDLNIMYVTYNENKAKDFTKKYVIHQLGTSKYAAIFPFVVTKNMLDKKDNTKQGSFQRKTATFSDTEFTLSCPIESLKRNYRGGYKCFGMEQGIHGSPANIFLVDDYVDKAQSVMSDNFRIQRREWFFNDMASRLQGNNSVVGAICTRWYHEDIIGLMEDTHKNEVIPLFEKYKKIPPQLNKVKIRTEYRLSDDNPQEDPRSEEGQLLWEEHLLKIAFAKKGAFFNAVYNCDPSATDCRRQLRDEDFGYYDSIPDVAGRWVFSIDGASTTKKRSDHTAIGLWFISGTKRYLAKIWYLKLETPDLIDFVVNLLKVEYPHYDDCLIEYANSGVTLVQTLRKKHHLKCKALGFSGREISDDTKANKGDSITKANGKLERYLRVLPEFQMEDKRIWLSKEPIEHQAEFIRQFTTFDGTEGKADDLVDMGTYLIFYTGINIIQAANTRRVNQKSMYSKNDMCYTLNNNSNANYGFNSRGYR